MHKKLAWVFQWVVDIKMVFKCLYQQFQFLKAVTPWRRVGLWPIFKSEPSQI
jgi:hypothetical protein